MFTGIIEEMGTVVAVDGERITFSASTVLEGSEIGDSIAVNGCCLTVVELGDGTWSADVVEESRRRTNLGRTAVGEQVNLERPVRVQDRLSGHVVQGHVDAMGIIVSSAPDLRVQVPADLLRYVVEKGSIAVDGISLTVVEVLDDSFRIAVIPHTAEVTTLGRKGPGDVVNIEVDIMGKHVERLLAWALPKEAAR